MSRGPYWFNAPNWKSRISDTQLALSSVHYAAEISTVRPTVHTNASRKRSFSKTRFKPVEFENAALRFCVYGNILKTEVFEKRWRYGNDVISLPEFPSTDTNPKWRRSVDREHH